MSKFRKLSGDDKLGVLLFLVSFIFIGMMVWACFKPSIWSDEAFSLLLIKKSYLDVIAVTSMDVHPPLYYFILKFVVSLFQSFNLTPNSVIILGRFVSVVPFVLLLILDLFKVREYWGWLCCGVFAVCLTSMPQLMHFAVEIRMYSWALFFVTVCFIYAYEITHNFNVPNWIIFLFSGVCAAYTHYFAAISVIIIYLLIFNQLRIRKWVISVIASLTLYLFWLFVLIHQLIKVTANFWIEPITIDVVFSYLWFIVSPSNIFHPSIELIGVLLVISYLIVFIYYFIKCGYENQEYFILGGTFVLILTILVGIIVSILVKPIFIARYVVPSLGIFWLTFAFLLSRTWDYKKVFAPIMVIILLVSCISSITFINSEISSNDNYNHLDSFFKQDSIKNDEFFLDVDMRNFTTGCYYSMQYLLGGYHGLKFGTPSSDDILSIHKKSKELYVALKNNKTVWLFSSEEYDLILKNCTKKNLIITKQDSYMFELNNGCTLYKIA